MIGLHMVLSGIRMNHKMIGLHMVLSGIRMNQQMPMNMLGWTDKGKVHHY